jgi:hypothetical protein
MRQVRILRLQLFKRGVGKIAEPLPDVDAVDADAIEVSHDRGRRCQLEKGVCSAIVADRYGERDKVHDRDLGCMSEPAGARRRAGAR